MAYLMPNKPASAPIRPTTSMVGNAPARKHGSGSSWVKGVVTLVIVLIILGGGLYLLAGYVGLDSGLLSGNRPFKANWQAVFLTNGQVYFGKIQKMDNSYITLQNIYYLQVVTQPLQQSAGANNQPADSNAQTEQRLTLIKLGNELHGPRDEMLINRDQVVLMEDLKDDSRVVSAINDYLKNQK